MNIQGFMARAEIMFKGRLFNLQPAGPRREWRGRVINRVCDKYFQRYIPVQGTIPEVEPERDYAGEKIFSIWFQGEANAPALVKACFRSVRHHCTQPHVVLDSKTLGNWIELPGYVMDKWRKGKIGYAHFADIARVELLHTHGGYWMDATDFVTAPIAREVTEADFFMYLAGSINSYTCVQNCFIRSRRGAWLLEAWRSMILEYWRHESTSLTYFMHQLLFKVLIDNEPTAAKYFEQMPHWCQDPTHRLWWSEKMGSKQFDQAEFDRLTAGAFFEKTNYRDWYAKNPPPGSFADEMINRMCL